MKKLKGMVRLFRPELSLAAGFCVIVGQMMAGGKLPDWQTGIFGFLSVFCLSGSALILNDYFDYEVDLINAPGRPLPSGLVSRRDVLILSAATTLVGLGLALALSLPLFGFSLVVWLIGFLYNWRFKEAGLVGNLMVSTSVAVTFLFGATSVRAPWNELVWVFSLMAFFVDLGEEIAGDAMDMEGDQKRSLHSIALKKGRRFAVRLAVVLWGVVIVLSLVPVICGWLGALYLGMILLTDVLLVFFSIRLLKAQTPEAGRKAMRGAYLSETLCIIAFIVGRLWG